MENFIFGFSTCNYPHVERGSMDFLTLFALQNVVDGRWVYRAYYGKSKVVHELFDPFDIKEFWETWKEHKEELKARGFGAIKDRMGNWLVFIYQKKFLNWLNLHWKEDFFQQGFCTLKWERFVNVSEEERILFCGKYLEKITTPEIIRKYFPTFFQIKPGEKNHGKDD